MPAKLIGMFISGGAIIGGAVGSVITNKYRDLKDKKELKTLGTYSVTKDAEIKKIKLVLKTGDQIAILAADDDSILIIQKRLNRLVSLTTRAKSFSLVFLSM